jgi:hypothetical protein
MTSHPQRGNRPYDKQAGVLSKHGAVSLLGQSHAAWLPAGTPPTIFKIEWNFSPIRDGPRSRFFTRKPIHRQQLFVGQLRATAKKNTGEAQVLIAITNLQILKMSNAELATSYAALILADDGVDITVRIFLLGDPAKWAV